MAGFIYTRQVISASYLSLVGAAWTIQDLLFDILRGKINIFRGDLYKQKRILFDHKFDSLVQFRAGKRIRKKECFLL